MTKCARCFTDAGNQTCKTCGASACDNHIKGGICTANHEQPEQSKVASRTPKQGSPEA